MAASGLTVVRMAIAEACERAGVPDDSVELLVVSKQRSAEELLAVYDEGHRLFAENREQGLKQRCDGGLPDDIVWHFVGPLQSRKIASVASHASLLHSMDRMSLAQKWGRRTDVPVLIQFNLAGEEQKSGFNPDDADRVIDEVAQCGVRVRGVMAIPPMSNDPEDVRPWFAKLRKIYDTYAANYPGIDVCSMGMSNDFGVAIEEGATIVRVGRAIFAATERPES
ncbi:MAG: YggS family pyridoxal phosphate-dependent enzyme [Acidimicrobiia bacterium]